MANRQNTLLLKRSNIIGKIPPISGLTLGEMALNTADAKLYSLFTSGTTGATEVREIGWNRIHRTGDTVTGDFTFYGDIQISGSSQPNGYALSVTGDTTQLGDTIQVGNYNVTGNTNQLGYLHIVSATTGCTLAVTGNTCLDGDLDISGNTFMSGNFCMNNMNTTGQTGTNCFDTSQISTGTTVINSFQDKSGTLAHIGDLATGEPNSRGFTYFENNVDVTSFTSVGVGNYTPVIGAPQTFGPYNNLFIVTTGNTTATTNKMTYDYPLATSGNPTYLKFTVSVTMQNANNQALTYQVRRTRNSVVTFIPIGMSLTPQSNTRQGITFNGISDAIHNDEFEVVVKNDTGSGVGNNIRVVDLAFSMFT